MAGLNLKKLSHFLSLVRFKLGEFLFPVLEPVFRMIENRNPEVKKHFDQALGCLEERKPAIALLNLNMVLSLNSNHFLARVYRGRIYVKEGRHGLASEDYLQANRINRYRFIHYDLYREYFRAVKREFGELETSIAHNFNQVFEVLRQSQDKLTRETENDESKEAIEKYASLEDREFEEEELSNEERAKFRHLGPITQREVEETDWDQLSKELSS